MEYSKSEDRLSELVLEYNGLVRQRAVDGLEELTLQLPADLASWRGTFEDLRAYQRTVKRSVHELQVEPARLSPFLYAH